MIIAKISGDTLGKSQALDGARRSRPLQGDRLGQETHVGGLVSWAFRGAVEQNANVEESKRGLGTCVSTDRRAPSVREGTLTSVITTLQCMGAQWTACTGH